MGCSIFHGAWTAGRKDIQKKFKNNPKRHPTLQTSIQKSMFKKTRKKTKSHYVTWTLLQGAKIAGCIPHLLPEAVSICCPFRPRNFTKSDLLFTPFSIYVLTSFPTFRLTSATLLHYFHMTCCFLRLRVKAYFGNFQNVSHKRNPGGTGDEIARGMHAFNGPLKTFLEIPRKCTPRHSEARRPARERSAAPLGTACETCC